VPKVDAPRGILKPGLALVGEIQRTITAEMQVIAALRSVRIAIAQCML
jgi:hypothetical protein